MSGGGGSRDDFGGPVIPVPKKSSGVGGSGPATGGDPCAIVQQAPLNSPRPAVVSTINVGDILDVVLNAGGPRPVLEVHRQGAVAGSLTHTGHVAIIDCIRQGHRYVADVVSRSGGALDLLVRPA